ncbi:MAG: hypothetical protein FJZ58_05825 [Chlamydiae bacterium]|nr:hypothetical protein [Chlamydiota bacterium]
MRVKDRQKICSHCEGRISVEADTCLYCGMPLIEEKAEEKPVDVMSTLQGGIPSLYPPLYAQAKQEVPLQEPTATAVHSSALQEDKEEKASLLSIVWALLGSTFGILGVMQGFFSEGDTLRLEWNCQYWFLYVLLAMPLLYLGLKNRSPSK